MKKFLLLLVPILFLIGCESQNDSLFYLDDAYYGHASFPLINGDELRVLEDNENSFIAFVFMPMCNASALFYDVVSEFVSTYEISMYQIQFSDIENTRMADAITYFPTAVLYHDGVVSTFLQTDNDDHIPYYQSTAGFKSWLAQYIYFPLPRHSSLEAITFEADIVNIYYFWGDGCPHCASQFEFLTELNAEMGERFNLYSFEVWFDEFNAGLAHQIADIMADEFIGVPFTIIGNQAITGFIPDDILDAIEAANTDEFDAMRIFKDGR